MKCVRVGRVGRIGLGGFSGSCSLLIIKSPRCSEPPNGFHVVRMHLCVCVGGVLLCLIFLSLLLSVYRLFVSLLGQLLCSKLLIYLFFTGDGCYVWCW